jgi:hypothetical protein
LRRIATENGGRSAPTRWFWATPNSVSVPKILVRVNAFNEQFGNIDWKDGDKIHKVIAEEIPVKVAADRAY